MPATKVLAVLILRFAIFDFGEQLRLLQRRLCPDR